MVRTTEHYHLCEHGDDGIKIIASAASRSSLKQYWREDMPKTNDYYIVACGRMNCAFATRPDLAVRELGPLSDRHRRLVAAMNNPPDEGTDAYQMLLDEMDAVTREDERASQCRRVQKLIAKGSFYWD